MSAALQLPFLWEAINSQRVARISRRPARTQPPTPPEVDPSSRPPEKLPSIGLAFYRKHTEKMLRRYLYASMQVGRAPNILGDPIARGWVSSRPVRTFEDAVIFVLDIEACLNSLVFLDRQLLSRIVIQEYTHTETAALLGMSLRSVSYKFPLALDRLTEKLLETGLLILPL
jgi:hypothetical protein